MRVLVTGATGFVGVPVVQRLLTDGYSVTAVSRGRAIPDEADALVVEDLTAIGPDDLEGIDAVVNLAGIAHSRYGDEVEYVRVNHRAAVDLALRSRDGGVRRFVQMSTSKVYGDGPMVDVSPRSPVRPIGAYARSKAAADRTLLREVATPDFCVICLQPPLVVGPHAKGNIGMLAKVARAGVPIPVAASDPLRSTIRVDHLAGAVAAVVGDGEPRSAAFTIADQPPRSVSQLLHQVLPLGEKRPRVIKVPDVLFRPIVAASRGRLAPLSVAFTLSSEAFEDRFGVGWRPL